jgi:hypothetical protein
VNFAFKFLLASALVVFVFLILWVAWVWHRTESLEQAFSKVHQGDSPAQVIELFTQSPLVTTDVETNIGWDETWTNMSGSVKCVKQFHFYPPFTICGESWAVGFDEHSNVVSKFHIVSP